ncbi:MAG: zinc ribbon domain-containing protein [Candidatus Omnitrophica bacterium]|nr:zinc ribbon domain-containing protein [Candidatus Omnitrophota bacterium]
MPTYEYECKKCGHRFEKFQQITQAPLKSCPKCHGRLKRLIGTGGGIIFKGSGFYATDYRNKKYHDDKQSAEKACDKTCPSCPLEKDKKSGNKT